MRRAIAVALAAAAAALAAAPAAAASDVCVAPRTGCAISFVDLHDALNAAAADVDADRVLLGAAAYDADGGFTYDSPAPVEIAGDPGGGTVLFGSATTILHVVNSGVGSRVHDLTVDLTGDFGIQSDADLDHVSVVQEEAEAGLNRAIVLTGGADLAASDVFMNHDAGTGLGVEVDEAGSTVSDVVVDAEWGFRNDGIGTRLERVRAIPTATGIAMYGPGTIRDCTVRMTETEGPIPEGIVLYDSGAVAIDGCTIVGETPLGVGLTVFESAEQSSLTATGLAIRGFFKTLTHGDDTDMDIRYSDLDVDNVFAGSGGTLVFGAGVDYHEDARFVDRAAGDFRLRHDSPLVDRGDPSPGPPAWSLDLDLLPRQVDGDGDGDERVDIGPFEYQRRAPSAALAGPDAGVAGQVLAFTASGEDPDPGEAPAFAWRVDGAPAGSGVTFEHVFATPGPHTVELVATDPAGLSVTAAKTVTVEPAPVSGGRPSPPGATPPPTPPAGPRAVVRLPRFARLRGGRIRLALRCEGAPCIGTLTLRARGRRIGRVRFALAAGRSRTLSVRVGRRRARRLRIVQAAVRVDNGSTVARRLRVRRGSRRAGPARAPHRAR
jgi:hypothetical protein